MKLSILSLVLTSILLVVSCNTTQESPTPKPSYSDELAPCVDPALNMDLGESATPKKHEPSADTEQPGYTEKDPGCILEGTN